MPRMIAIKHIDREGPSLFEQVALEASYEVCVLSIDDVFSISHIRSGDIVVLLGGPMSVSDIINSDQECFRKELELIDYLVTHNIPFIGICLGAQLLAHVTGGIIIPLRSNYSSNLRLEIGWSKIFFNSSYYSDSLLTDLPTNMDVLHWHGDRIILPPKAKLIAESNMCREQIFTIGKRAVGLQCHVEVTDNDVYRWINEDISFIKKGLGNEGKDILYKQQKKYGNSSLRFRVNFIRNILFNIQMGLN